MTDAAQQKPSAPQVAYNLADIFSAHRHQAWSEVVQKPLPSEWIKEREGSGGRKFRYIEGHKVAELIEQATGGTYAFFILDYIIQPSHPRTLVAQRYDNQRRRSYRDPVHELTCSSCSKPYRFIKSWGTKESACPACGTKHNTDLWPGTPVTTPEPPVAHVLGQLVVPGVGSVSQWGSKVMEGGAYEQEHALKAAATDAFKKCASMLGIARELWDDAPVDAGGFEERKPYEPPRIQQQPALAQPPQAAASEAPRPQPAQQSAAPQIQQPAASPQANGQAQANGQPANGKVDTVYPAKQVERLKDIMSVMGISNRELLNPLVQTWSKHHGYGGGKLTSFRNITPELIGPFCDYLESMLAPGGKSQAS